MFQTRVVAVEVKRSDCGYFSQQSTGFPEVLDMGHEKKKE